MLRLILALALFANLADARAEPPVVRAEPARSVVFTATDSQALYHFEENPEVVRRMVNRLVLAVTGETDSRAAWARLVKPTDRVGIKVSTAGGRNFSTHRAIVEAVVAGLRSVGVPPERTIVWDRSSALLRQAGYVSNSRYQVRAVDPPNGFDGEAKFIAPAFGKLIWGDLLFRATSPLERGRAFSELKISTESHFARIVTQEVDRIVNLAMFSDERGCGVAGALYNVTVPNVDNERRFTQEGGTSSICDLYADEHVRPKVVFSLVDGLLAQYANGPGFDPNYAFAFHTLLASRDPVALDTTVLHKLEEWRKMAQLPPIGEMAGWVAEAEALGLGHATPAGYALQSAP